MKKCTLYTKTCCQNPIDLLATAGINLIQVKDSGFESLGILDLVELKLEIPDDWMLSAQVFNGLKWLPAEPVLTNALDEEGFERIISFEIRDAQGRIRVKSEFTELGEFERGLQSPCDSSTGM